MQEVRTPTAAFDPQPSACVTKFEREKAAFHRLLPSMLRNLKGQYVAIHNEQIVGTGNELVAVAMTAYQQFGFIPIYVDLVTDSAQPVRLPHPRIISA